MDYKILNHRSYTTHSWSRNSFVRPGLVIVGLGAIMIALFLATALILDIAGTHSPPHPPFSDLEDSASHRHSLGAVVSASDVCSLIGTDVLRKGGNAVDAAIATEFCLGVTMMWITGLAAGGFAVINDPRTGAVECVDFRETAPGKSYTDMYHQNGSLALYGGLAVGTPGEVRGLQYIHQKYATMSWADLIKPSIKVARNGFVVKELLMRAINDMIALKGNLFVNDPSWAIDFAPNGVLVKEGDIMTRKRYADVLELLATQGPDSFYSAETANSTVRAVTAAGGILSEDDLAGYSVVSRPVLKIKYQSEELLSCPSPAGGAVVLMTLNILQQFGDVGPRADRNVTLHRFIEAMKFAYGYRTLMGDPAFVDGQAEYEDDILKPSFAAEIKHNISDEHVLPLKDYLPLNLSDVTNHGTSHTSVADRQGMFISMTTTVNTHFGSLIMVPETGLILNNEMDDFAVPGVTNAFGFEPSPANYVLPGKRPLSSISPVLVRRGGLDTIFASVGAAGGSRIISGVAQVLWKLLDLELTPKDAVGMPRFHDQLIPNQTVFEYTFDNHTVAYMRQRGHNVTWDIAGADVHSIKRLRDGTFEAAAEPRLPDSGGYAV